MVKSAERVAEALRFLAQNPAGALYSELQRGLSLPKSSLHALMNTLVETRLAVYDPANKRYALGPLMWELALAFSRQLQLVPIALPVLERISARCGETTQLAVLDGAEVVYVAKVPSRYPVQLVSDVGSRLPAYATGIGKALLACLTNEQVDRLYPDSALVRFTAATVGSKADLMGELRAIRQRGYARDEGEYSVGIRCLAVPILTAPNLPNAAMSISMPLERYIGYRETELADMLRHEADALAQRLGAVKPDEWRRINEDEAWAQSG